MDGFFFITASKRDAHLRDGSSWSQYQAVVRYMFCAACKPSACTSVISTSKPAIFIFGVSPNSFAALTALLVSLAELASPSTCAPEACACRMNDEKSAVFRGCRTRPLALPPSACTTADASRSSAWPKAWSTVRKNQSLLPSFIMARAVPRASDTVSYT
ncbi:hypothetical protein D3C86_1631740 [compost metagenome]